MYIHMYIHMYTTHMYIHMYIHMSIHMYIHMKRKNLKRKRAKSYPWRRENKRELQKQLECIAKARKRKSGKSYPRRREIKRELLKVSKWGPAVCTGKYGFLAKSTGKTGKIPEIFLIFFRFVGGFSGPDFAKIFPPALRIVLVSFGAPGTKI